MLADWAARIAAQPWNEAYVFFKHDEASAPVLRPSARSSRRSTLKFRLRCLPRNRPIPERAGNDLITIVLD
jgi:hypothetical protein